MLGIRTLSRRMVGADKTKELWRPPHLLLPVETLETILVVDFDSSLTTLVEWLEEPYRPKWCLKTL